MIFAPFCCRIAESCRTHAQNAFCFSHWRCQLLLRTDRGELIERFEELDAEVDVVLGDAGVDEAEVGRRLRRQVHRLHVLRLLAQVVLQHQASKSCGTSGWALRLSRVELWTKRHLFPVVRTWSTLFWPSHMSARQRSTSST